MNYKGKAQFSLTIVAPADLVADGDRFFKLHAEWMAKTHHRDGEKALLQYNVAKSSDSDGKIIYVLTEVYETVAGIEDHRQQAPQTEFFEDFRTWRSKCQVIGGEDEEVIQSLW